LSEYAYRGAGDLVKSELQVWNKYIKSGKKPLSTTVEKRSFLAQLMDNQGMVWKTCQDFGCTYWAIRAAKKADPEFLEAYNMVQDLIDIVEEESTLSILKENMVKLDNHGATSDRQFYLKALNQNRYNPARITNVAIDKISVTFGGKLINFDNKGKVLAKDVNDITPDQDVKRQVVSHVKKTTKKRAKK